MTTITQDYDWSDLEDKVEVRDTNVMPRDAGTGTGRTPTGARRRSSRKSAKLDQLQTALSGQMFQAGSMIGLGLPVTGYYVAQESHNFSTAIVQLASKRAEWIDALEKVADIAPGITVGRTVLGIAASMGADRYHRTGGESGLDPDKRAAQFLGVTAAYYAVYKEQDASAGVTYAPAPHAAYQPVT